MGEIKLPLSQLVDMPLYPGQTYLVRKGDLTNPPVALVYDEEFVEPFCAAPDMLTALETVLAGGHLNSGEQAIVANAIAKATGRDVADVVKGA